jgi:hypothetical protein
MDPTLNTPASSDPASTLAQAQDNANKINENKADLEAWQTAQHMVADDFKTEDAVLGYSA